MSSVRSSGPAAGSTRSAPRSRGRHIQIKRHHEIQAIQGGPHPAAVWPGERRVAAGQHHRPHRVRLFIQNGIDQRTAGNETREFHKYRVAIGAQRPEIGGRDSLNLTSASGSSASDMCPPGTSRLPVIARKIMIARKVWPELLWCSRAFPASK